MRWLYLSTLIAVSTAQAWEIRLTEEQKHERADWIGRGVITHTKLHSPSSVSDQEFWTGTLAVSETLKGEPGKTIQFIYHRAAPARTIRTEAGFKATWTYTSCSNAPRIRKGEEVILYLEEEKVGEVKRLFLNSRQMITLVKLADAQPASSPSPRGTTGE